ncbi:MAG: tellurite resistance TerB family protein [Alphaproteobacteria bacterium]
MVNPHTALIYTMVLVSAADGEMTDAELTTIGQIVQTLPAFTDYDRNQLTKAAADCAEILSDEQGFDTAIAIIAEALPENLRETAYALACDVVAADLVADQAELRVLELLRHGLDIDRLSAAAIERGTRARHARA